MALTPTQREEYARYAFALFGQSKGQMSTIDVLTKAFARFGTPRDVSEQFQARATVNSMRLAFDRGATLQQLPGTTAAAPTVQDWRLVFGGEQYGWSVRVFVTNPNTGDRAERLVTIKSNSVLTADEIRRRAVADVQADPNPMARYPEMRGFQQTWQLTPVIVSAGRRP